MLFIFVQLRYHRQLSIISPETVTTFFRSISESVAKNGGNETTVSGGMVFRFSSGSVGYVFAASRVISLIAEELARNRTRIREYLVLVDSTERDEGGDFIAAHMEQYQRIPFPDAGILIAPTALTLLASYIRHESLHATPFERYTGTRLAEVPEYGGLEMEQRDTFSLYPEGGIDVFSSIIDLLDRMKIVPAAGLDAAAISLYKAYRYEYRKPDYIASAGETWLSSVLSSLPSSALPFTIRSASGGEDILSWLRDRFPAIPVIVNGPSPSFLPVDLQAIPEDLADLAYLVFRCSRYVYGSELPRFFASLGRDVEFLAELGRWMQSFGLLSDPTDFRSLNFSAFARLRDLLGARCAGLDSLIADFIWDAFENGELQPAFSLLDVLTELGFAIPDRFLVACLYHGENPAEGIERVSGLFTDPGLRETVINLERARTLFAEGNADETLPLAREVLHRFQKSGIPAGEFHALRLISDLSRIRSKGSDAVTYLEYALENAERIHDATFILNTRFEIAILHFANGDLSTAKSALARLERMIAANLAKETELASVFMNGRISFELGDYAGASALFQRAGTFAGSNGFPEAISLCKVWYARSVVHQHRYLQGMEMLSSCVDNVPEAWAFLIEASMLAGKPLPGKEFPESISSRYSPAKRTGPFDWSSGFSFAEDNLRPNTQRGTTPSRMFDAMLKYYRAVFGEASAFSDDMSGIAEIARRASESDDPSAQVYFYLCFLLGSAKNDAARPETLSFLSRAFKYLQLRAAAISDVSQREQYLQNPSWNNRLYRAARENKLI